MSTLVTFPAASINSFAKTVPSLTPRAMAARGKTGSSRVSNFGGPTGAAALAGAAVGAGVGAAVGAGAGAAVGAGVGAGAVGAGAGAAVGAAVGVGDATAAGGVTIGAGAGLGIGIAADAADVAFGGTGSGAFSAAAFFAAASASLNCFSVLVGVLSAVFAGAGVTAAGALCGGAAGRGTLLGAVIAGATLVGSGVVVAATDGVFFEGDIAFHPPKPMPAATSAPTMIFKPAPEVGE
jgi:hypothetical protein